MGSVNDSTEKLKVYRIVFEDLDLDGMSVQSIINELQQIVDDNPDVELVSSAHDYYSGSSIDIVSNRLETDEEYNSRQEYVKKEAEEKAKQKEMKSLMRKKNLSTEEKERLIQLIQENK